MKVGGILEGIGIVKESNIDSNHSGNNSKIFKMALKTFKHNFCAEREKKHHEDVAHKMRETLYYLYIWLGY